MPTKQQYLCQPLLDAVMANIRSPVFNHSLYRTFAPAMTAIHGPPITYVSPLLHIWSHTRVTFKGSLHPKHIGANSSKRDASMSSLTPLMHRDSSNVGELTL